MAIIALQDNGKGMSQTQAETFASNWRVIDQQPNTDDGFSSTVFQNIDDNSYVLSIRGTETSPISAGLIDWSTNLGDIGADGLAIAQAIDLFNYYQRLTARQGEDVVQYAYFPAGVNPEEPEGVTPASITYTTTTATADGELAGKHVTVAGHSLGGHLALIMSRLAPDFVDAVTTFNAPGFDPITSSQDTESFFTLLHDAEVAAIGSSAISSSWNEDKLNNLRMKGDIVSAVGTIFGGTQTATGEDSDPLSAHSMQATTDSLAVYNLFAIIDPSLNVETITDILQAMPVDSDNTLEAALAAVGGVYGKTYPATEIDRNGLYVNLYDLQASLPGQATITSLTDTSATSLQNQATNPAYLYALLNLNPFTITGADYSPLNVDGYLEKETYSENFLEDRAAFLFYSMPDNTNPDPIRYEQRGENGVAPFVVTDNQQSSSPSNYIFGTKEHDSMMGDQNEDHLYGMGFTSREPTVFRNKKTPLTTISEDVKVTALYFQKSSRGDNAN